MRLCGQQFTDLRRHEMTHTGEGGAPPRVRCTRATRADTTPADSGHLKKHMIAVRWKESPHTCERCGKGFVAPSALKPTRLRSTPTKIGTSEHEEPKEAPSRTMRAETFLCASSMYLPVFERAVV
ncbi:unnamed protein product [Ixodes pacificus]